MQGMRRDVERQLAKWISAAILAILAAFLGQKQLSTTKDYGPAPAGVTGVGRAIDGDSLHVGNSEVRLKGIDAPEGRQSCTRGGASWDCGNAARDELRRLIGKDMVTCQVSQKDKHARLLAKCSAGGRDMNSGMVASGMAVSYGGYLREEGDAKTKKRGLWAGEFQSPREWRHERGIGQ